MMTSDDSRSRETGLLQFAAEQRSFEIGGIRIGGTPGIRPAVLIGSMFYHGHKVMIDEESGEIDEEAAAALIRMQDDYAERTGNPGMLDVVGATPEALERHLEFAAGITEMPLLIDGTTVEVRMAGLDYVAKAGLAHRAVYNSIQPGIGDDELEAIGRAGVEAAIVLTYYLQDFTAKGRVHAVEELLPRLEAAGVRKPLIDTCVLDLATMGQALEAMVEVKSQFGLPAGGGVHNAVAMWRGLKSKMGKQAYVPCMASAAAMAIGVGADFVLYGPIEDAPSVFPAVAMADTALSQIAIERGHRPEKDHPRFRVG